MIKEYIGVLDSGVGGLSVLKRLYELMPYYNYIFFGDTKNVPYGTKTPDEIFNYTKDILEFFISKNVKNVVFACNTTSAIAYERLHSYFKNQLTIFPLIQTIAKDSIEGLCAGDTIAVLATKATVNSHKYKEEIQKINPKINTVELDCTGFVEIVENRLYDNPISIDLIKSKLETVKKHGAKRVILGCTHYPYLVNIFKNILDVEYFDPGLSLAKTVKTCLKEDTGTGDIKFYVSKNPSEFILSAKTFFDVKTAELVDIKAKVYVK